MLLRSKADARAAAKRPGWYVPPETADETANRTRVALWLADVLAAHGADAGTAWGIPDTGWRMVVTLARQAHPEWTPADGYMPSRATRSAAITALRERERTPDPFTGFGG